MRISMWLAIFLTVFGSVSAALVGTGVYQVSYLDDTETSPYYDENTITKLVEAGTQADDNPSGGYTGAGISLFSVASCLIAALSIIPMLTMMGIPWYIATILQAPIWIIYAMEFYAIRKQVVIG